MANRILVPVIYAPEEKKLKLPADKETIHLNYPDDWVQWQLENTPSSTDNASLALLFNPPLGPFQTVRSFNRQNLAAKGNVGPPAPGEPSTFHYHLFLIPENLPEQNHIHLATGGPFTVVNQSQHHNRSPWLKVTFPGTNGVPDVEPKKLLLFDGDVAFCEVMGLKQDHVVAFRFAEPPHFPGPFPTYFTTRVDGHGDRRLYAATFGNATGERNYVVEVWDKDGKPVGSTHDPSVDGLGRPPGT